MEAPNDKRVLISGASIAGLTTACLLHTLGYSVTIVERAPGLRTAGAAVNLVGEAIAVARRIGIYEQLKANQLLVERIDFKNADDISENAIDVAYPDEEIEVERDTLLNSLFSRLADEVTVVFNNRITDLTETDDAVNVTFSDGTQQLFDLVVGCDGLHSGVRTLCFGPEAQYAHFLNGYFSITIVDKLLIPPKTMQLYNEPDKAVILNAYNNKTDILFFFYAEAEIPYNYRDVEQQRAIILAQFAGQGWRSAELLTELRQSGNFYFDKFCQLKMPSWTKGRVALVGDAGYCASPAAGMGGSLAMLGAATLADALETHAGDVTAAFRAYNQTLRPFIEEVQATAEATIRESFILRTDAAIRARNAQPLVFQQSDIA